jgi:hypothetical protein
MRRGESTEMPDLIRCPFCNYETPYPARGRISECIGECYSTYSLLKEADDITRAKMRLVEIFFLDGEFTSLIMVDEIDKKCEFKKLPASEPNEFILFAREIRANEMEIDKLKDEGSSETTPVFLEVIEKLRYSMDRLERNLRTGGAENEKLLNDIKVIEKIARSMREKLEKTE